MIEFITESGVSLELCKIGNVNALQSLMSDAGIFTRMAGKEEDTNELLRRVKDWNRLFAYCIINGVSTNPCGGDLEELEAMGFISKSMNVIRLNWIRYGKSNGIDILTSQEEAAKLVMQIIEFSFADDDDNNEKHTSDNENK